MCFLHNNSRCFPFTLSKYQTDLDIYICLMKYTFSLTVPKWLIYCYVMISIKISSWHKIEMLSVIAVWSEECFLHRNKWCMFTSQFCVKPENPRPFLSRKKLPLEVFFFLSLRRSIVQQRNGGKQLLMEFSTPNEISRLSSHHSRSSHQSVTQIRQRY